MDRKLGQRLLGAAVITGVAMLVVPLLLQEPQGVVPLVTAPNTPVGESQGGESPTAFFSLQSPLV
ncbi:MAG: hypothetical protein ACFCBW_16915, partial [Candidatus Competibacterales bacterium]